MLFCPKCGSIMMPKRRDGKAIAACRCGYSSNEKPASLKEEVKRPDPVAGVVEEQDNLPSIEEKCPECGYTKAFYWTMQTRAADEGETKFLKCQKCRHIWRDYG